MKDCDVFVIQANLSKEGYVKLTKRNKACDEQLDQFEHVQHTFI